MRIYFQSFPYNLYKTINSTLDEKIIQDASKFLQTGQKTELNYPIKNTDRAVGTRLSSTIYRTFKNTEVNKEHLTINLTGSAGQSLGALAGQGLVNIQLKNYEKAIRSYEQAQEIYPAMRSPKIMIKQIEELMKQQTI